MNIKREDKEAIKVIKVIKIIKIIKTESDVINFLRFFTPIFHGFLFSCKSNPLNTYFCPVFGFQILPKFCQFINLVN